MQVIGITTKIVKVRKEKEEQSCNTNKEDINNYLESKRCLSIAKDSNEKPWIKERRN